MPGFDSDSESRLNVLINIKKINFRIELDLKVNKKREMSKVNEYSLNNAQKIKKKN